MEFEHVNQIESVCDNVFDLFHSLNDDDKFSELKKLMTLAAQKISDGQSITFSMRFTLDDSDLAKQIPFLDMGLTCGKDETPFFFEGVSTLATYVLSDGSVQRIPHDRCPCCWDNWDFKLDSPECPSCGIQLGKGVKQMIDSDICPHCEKGKVSMQSCKCNECGYELDSEKILWG